jgi:hypothetical protein
MGIANTARMKAPDDLRIFLILLELYLINAKKAKIVHFFYEYNHFGHRIFM